VHYNVKKYGKEHYSKLEREKRFRLRLRVLEVLGNKCQCKDPNCWCKGKCDITDIRLLQIDHINGGGTKENLHVTQRSYKIIKNENNYREIVQLLCANCNWLKGSPSPRCILYVIHGYLHYKYTTNDFLGPQSGLAL